MGKNKRQFLLSHQNQDQNKTSIGGGGLTVFYPRIGKIGLIRTWNCINGSSLCLFIDSQ